MRGEIRFPDDLRISGLKDVTGSVWLAAALMTYDRAQELDPTQGPYEEETFAFRQVDIKQVAEQLCAKDVQSARIGQFTNGDHPENTYNYLREVGKKRRLSRPDEFEDRVVPHNLLPLDAPVLAFGTSQLRYKELVQWVFSTYPNLVASRPETETAEPTPQTQAPEPTSSKPQGTRGAYPDGIVLRDDDEGITFYHAELVVEDETRSNVFAEMTSKTAREILDTTRYASIRDELEDLPDAELSRPIGPLLADLKDQGNEIYQRFLNDNGDLTYRDFSVEAPDLLDKKGLYVFLVDGEIAYIGKTTATFKQRFDQNYGRIYPRNCFLDGQSTNCRLNHLVAEHADGVAIYLCAFTDDAEIDRLEDALIDKYQPVWNIQGAL